jgi:hypothetical protein
MEPTGGKGGAADQSGHGRMGLGTAWKKETSRMKNISIESSGGKNCAFTEMRVYIKVLRHLNYTRELTVVLDSQSEIKVSVNFALHTCHV